MSRYHYSRHAPSSARSESLGPRQSSNGHLSKSINSIATTSNNHTHSPPMAPKSSYIPLVRNSRPTTSEKRDFVQIPVKREDGTTVTHNGIRSIPINFINETTPSSSNTINSTNGINHIRDTDSPPRYASLLRPSPKYFQHHPNNTNTATARDESEEPNSQQIPITLNDNLPRLQTNSRRLSLTIPVMTPTAPRSPPDDDQSKQNSMNSPVRSIPVRLSQPLNVASIPTNSTRISSAILRSSPPMNPLPNHLQRQKTDLVNNTISSDFTSMPVNISPVRRAELMAREAIQGIARFQQQQQQAPLPTPPQPLLQQRKLSISEGGPSDTSVRSPLLSRRVIVNLKNNQSVSLDSRISSATSLPTKPPSVAATSRSNQRNNLYHIPVLHEIQIPPHPATVATESLLNFPRSPASNHRNPNNYKNEFRMEIPVSVVTNNDQENLIQNTMTSTDGLLDYEPPIPNVPGLRLPSTSSNQALKSILKRSASRETVLRKNVSFMNA